MMKRSAMGIAQPPGRLAGEKIVIRRWIGMIEEEAGSWMPNRIVYREKSWESMVRRGREREGRIRCRRKPTFSPAGL
jgi:hypothetical protein